MNRGDETDVAPTCILSVSEHFGTTPVPFAGHEESYQLGLQRAGAAVGLDWRILAPRASVVEATAVERCLATDSQEALVASLDAVLRDGSSSRVIVLYEGSVALATALSELALAHPRERFIVNLYRRERTIDVPLLPGSPVRLSVELEDLAGDVPVRTRRRIEAARFPPNLLLTAETPRKALLARSFGLPVRGVWRLHSEYADFSADPARSDVPSHAPAESISTRVLIALSPRQFDDGTIRHVSEVVEVVSRLGDATDPIQWILPCDEVILGQHRLVRRLERAGVRLQPTATPLSRDDYAKQFLDADAVWLPKVWPYRVTSSGKALDAIVLGRPVIAPAGTAAADAMQRWVPGALDYGTTEEAIALFLRLPTLLPTVTEDLARTLAEARQEYSAQATVDWLLALLNPSDVRDEAIVGSCLSSGVDHDAAPDRLEGGPTPRRRRTSLRTTLASILADGLVAFRRQR